MLELDKYEFYTLDEILRCPDVQLREEILRKRNIAINRLLKDRFYRKIIDREDSLIDIYQGIEEAESEYESWSIFPGDTLLIYPQFRERKASRETICDVSGAIINAGSLYVNYQLFIDNVTQNRRYVLSRPWRAEIGGYDIFPTTVPELDHLDMKLRNSYEHPTDGMYDYYDMSTRIGDGISLRHLEDKPKVKIKTS